MRNNFFRIAVAAAFAVIALFFCGCASMEMKGAFAFVKWLQRDCTSAGMQDVFVGGSHRDPRMWRTRGNDMPRPQECGVCLH